MEGVSRPAHIYFQPSCPVQVCFFFSFFKPQVPFSSHHYQLVFFPLVCLLHLAISSSLARRVLILWELLQLSTRMVLGRAKGPGGAQGLAQRCSPHLRGLHLSHITQTPLRI